MPDAAPLYEQLVNLLAAILLLLAFAMLAQRRIYTLINLFAAQGVALFLSTAVAAHATGQVHLYFSAGLTLVLKVIVLPWILHRLVQRLDVKWDVERLMELELRLGLLPGGTGIEDVGDDGSTTVVLGIDDAALLLDGMAFTEVASADLPWIEMVRWTSDFVTGELRSHWTQSEWLQLSADSG